MWEKLLKTLTGASFIVEQGRRNADELKELRNKHHELSLAVQRLALEVERLRQSEAHEREKLILRVENLLLNAKVSKPSKTRTQKKLSG